MASLDEDELLALLALLGEDKDEPLLDSGASHVARQNQPVSVVPLQFGTIRTRIGLSASVSEIGTVTTLTVPTHPLS